MYTPALDGVGDPTGVAVIGCGYWGMNYVRVFTELPDARVVAVCDERRERLDEVARRFPGTALTTSLDETLALPGVDAVVVCTPASSHREVGGRALDAGKHLLVEKPLTVTVADAEELVDLAEAADRILLTGHTFLYNPGVRKIKRLVQDGALGRTYYLYARRTNLGPFRSDVNALWDLAPHDIAIFNHLLGQVPEWASAVGGRVLSNGREDVGFISLGYPGGVVAHIHVSWADPSKVREFVIVGSDRRIAFNDLDLVERVRVFDQGVSTDDTEATSFGEHLQVREGDITAPALRASEPLKNLCGHLLHCVRRGERPLSDGRDGRDVVAVMEGIGASVADHGAPVAIDRAGTYEVAALARSVR